MLDLQTLTDAQKSARIKARELEELYGSHFFSANNAITIFVSELLGITINLVNGKGDIDGWFTDKDGKIYTLEIKASQHPTKNFAMSRNMNAAKIAKLRAVDYLLCIEHDGSVPLHVWLVKISDIEDSHIKIWEEKVKASKKGELDQPGPRLTLKDVKAKGKLVYCIPPEEDMKFIKRKNELKAKKKK